MNKNEFGIFMAMVRDSYPSSNFLSTPSQMELWFSFLEDIPFEVIKAGMSKWVTENKFTPSIADLRQMAVDVKLSPDKPWEEAWESVLRAIRYYGSYREDEALSSLDDITRECVNHLGFKRLCMTEESDLGFERANFRDMYNRKSTKKNKDALLPAKLKETIANMQMGAIEKHE